MVLCRRNRAFDFRNIGDSQKSDGRFAKERRNSLQIAIPYPELTYFSNASGEIPEDEVADTLPLRNPARLI